MRAWSSTSISSPNSFATACARAFEPRGEADRLHVARAQGAHGRTRELRDLGGAVVGALADADEQQSPGLRPAARSREVQVDGLALLALQLLGFENRADEAARRRVEVFQESFVGLLVFEDGDGQGLHVRVGGAPAARLNVHSLFLLSSFTLSRAPSTGRASRAPGCGASPSRACRTTFYHEPRLFQI